MRAIKYSIMIIIVSSFLFAQFDFSGMNLGFTITSSPWELQSDGSSVTLGSDADSSPVPSVVDYFEEGKDRTTSFGLIAKEYNVYGTNSSAWEYAVMLEINSLLSSEQTIASAIVGPGIYYTIGLSDKLKTYAGSFIYLGYIWGTIGEVGTAPGDYYLGAPDGEDYETGSRIEVFKFALGIDFNVGIDYEIIDNIFIRVGGGLRGIGTAADWRYRVVDDIDSERSSELPASGFGYNPLELNLSGGFFKVTLVYGL